MATKSRKKRSTSADEGSSALGIVIWIVTRIGIPLALVLGLLWWRIDAFVRHGIEEASSYAQITRGRTFYWFNGDVGVTKLSITPRVNNPRNTSISAERLTVHTPGLYWLVSSAIFGLHEPPKRIGMTMQNLDAVGIAHAPGTDWIGLYSASPFEAEGCSANDWTRSDLGDMGLPPQPALFTWMMEFPSPDEGKMTWEWQTAGVGSAQGIANFKFAGNVMKSNSAISSGELTAGKLTFTDHGFVAARNRYCAGRLHLPEPAFVDRHVGAVRRVLLSHGVEASPELEQLYRGFSSKGGQMDVQLRPQTTLNMASVATLTAASWQEILSPVVSLDGGTPVLLTLNHVQRVPLGLEGDAILAAREQPDPVNTLIKPVGDKPVLVAKAEIKPDAAKVAVPAAGSSKPSPASGAPSKAAQDVAYADLEKHVGERITVHTTFDTERTGTLAKFNNLSLTLNFDNGAIMTFLAKNVRSTTLAPDPSVAAPSSPGTGNSRAKKN